MYSSDKKHKLIFENWRRFLKEEEEMGSSGELTAGGITAKDLLSMKLPAFVGALNSNKREIIGAILKGLEDGDTADDAVTIKPTSVAIKNLRPTQNEVVFHKSVPFAIQNPSVFMEQSKSNGPHKVGKPNNNAIITLNGKFILDGHHRWSSLFCVNPKAKIYTFDIRARGLPPLNALKLMQASIKQHVMPGTLPSAQGGGDNLFTIESGQIEALVKELLTDEIKAKFVQLGLAASPEEVEGKLIPHYQKTIKLLQRNKPVGGASSREPMPQTDAPADANVVAGGETPATLKPLEKGQVDWKPPFKTRD